MNRFSICWLPLLPLIYCSRTARNSAEGHAAQSFTDKSPAMEFEFALESSVAIRENTCPPLHPTSFIPFWGSGMLTLIVVPSMSPDAEGITKLANLSAKYLPDCEIVKSTSCIVAIDPAHV